MSNYPFRSNSRTELYFHSCFVHTGGRNFETFAGEVDHAEQTCEIVMSFSLGGRFQVGQDNFANGISYFCLARKRRQIIHNDAAFPTFKISC